MDNNDLNNNQVIFNDNNEAYRWIYELPMLKSFFLLFEVWKVMGVAALGVVVINIIIDLIAGNGFRSILSNVGVGLLVLAILFVLSLPAYYIVTKANNGKYTVLFEMDARGISHTQIKLEKAKALNGLAIFTGIVMRNRTTTAAGILSASGSSLYSKFSKVRKIRIFESKNLICLDSMLVHNQVYCDSEIFDFVKNYLIDHCPMAVVIDEVVESAPAALEETAPEQTNEAINTEVPDVVSVDIDNNNEQNETPN